MRLTVLIFLFICFGSSLHLLTYSEEPILLIGLQLIFWAIIAIAESFVITIISEK